MSVSVEASQSAIASGFVDDNHLDICPVDADLRRQRFERTSEACARL
jgi:hypothetical protein